MAVQDNAICILKSDIERIDKLVRAGLYPDRNNCIQAAIAQLLAAHDSKQLLAALPHFTFGWVGKSIPAC